MKLNNLNFRHFHRQKEMAEANQPNARALKSNISQEIDNC